MPQSTSQGRLPDGAGDLGPKRIRSNPSRRQPNLTPQPSRANDTSQGTGSAGGVLALDLGTTTGWCVGDQGGEITFPKTGRSSAEKHQTLAVAFSGWLSDLLVRYSPDTVLLEAPFFSARQPAAGALLFGMRMVALGLAGQRRVVETAPTSWQSWARRQGWAKIDGAGGHVHDARYMRAHYLSL